MSSVDTIHFESRYGVVICHLCQGALVFGTDDSLEVHFRRKPHFLKGDALRKVMRQIAEWPVPRISNVTLPVARSHAVRPIHRVKIESGYRCQHCIIGMSQDLKNMKTHLRQAHQRKEGKDGQDYESCSIQTLFQNRRYWRWIWVDENASTGLSPGESQIAEGQERPQADGYPILEVITKAEQEKADLVQLAQANKTQKIPWVQSCGFDRFLGELSRREIVAAVGKPTHSDESASIVKIIMEGTIGVLNDIFRICLPGPNCRLTRPMATQLSKFGDVEPGGFGGFRVNIQQDTKQKYFAAWSGIMATYYRVVVEEQLTCETETGEKLPLWPEKEEHAWAWRSVWIAAEAEDDSALREAIFKFSTLLIRQPLFRGIFDSPILCYCALNSIKPTTLAWKTPGNFNSFLSGLTYCAQLITFRESVDQADSGSGGPSEDHDDILQRLCQKWIHKGRSNTWGIILEWRLTLRAAALDSISDNQVQWSQDGETISFKTSQISMAQITRLYHHTVNRARQILDRDLLLGASHLLRMKASTLYESWQREEIDWWFGLDPRNQQILEGTERALLDHIHGQPELHNDFLAADLSWKVSAMELYENTVQEFLACLCVLFQVYPPIRGSECLSVTWRNSDHRRSITIKDSRLMFMTTYHKGQALRGTYKTNLRWPTEEINNLVLDFLIYVQPLRKVFLWTKMKETLPPQLWTKHGQVWRDDCMSSIFMSVCAEAQVPQMKESHWRQISSSIVKIKFGDHQTLFSSLGRIEKSRDGDVEDEDAGENSISATLARIQNHTPRTANTAYANVMYLPGTNLWDGLVRSTFQACGMWGEFFKFEEKAGETRVGTRRARATTATDIGMVKRLGMAQPPKSWTSAALLKEARLLSRDPKFAWRCIEQERAAWFIAMKKMEVLVVMATGMGKSLLFQLCSVLPGASTTVLVIPLVALRLDMIRRCLELGIDCQEWSIDHQPQCQLCIMSVEAAVSGEGHAYLHRLHFAKLLDRIVIDECHLILTAHHYRPAIGQLACLRSLPVPFVYLTATLPPSQSPQLFRFHHLTQVQEIRGSTSRANIGYRVIELEAHAYDVVKGAADMIKKAWEDKFGGNQGRSRALIFVKSKDKAEKLARLLETKCYHSGIESEEEKAGLIGDWAAGTSCSLLVGTSGLGVGLDYPEVRMVFHVEDPYGLIDFCQESGRAGRDGKPAESVVYLRYGWQPARKIRMTEDENEMARYLKDPNCRRQVLDQYMDGKAVHTGCSIGSSFCDNCQDPMLAEVHVPVTTTSSPSPSATTVSSSFSSSPPVATTVSPQLSRAHGSAMGPQAMLVHAQQGDRTMRNYRNGLCVFLEVCIMCRMTPITQMTHNFRDCQNPHKASFLAAKKTVKSRAGNRWIAAYHACFWCFQPQDICTSRGSGPCKYPDLVMQAVYMKYVKAGGPAWYFSQFAQDLENVEDCLEWAGKSSRLGEMQCIRGVNVLSKVFMGMCS